MSYEIDEFGYPVDPEMFNLERKLGWLASQYRNVSRGVEKQNEIVEEYGETFYQLYELGWRGSLDVDAELPYELMPSLYFNQE